MENTPIVSVIIPVFNDYKRLDRCLEALFQQTFPGETEIIVADNNSSRVDESILEKYKGIIKIVVKKRGSYAARNSALQICKGDIIAFTDSDCIPAADWIEKGVSNLLSISGCGIIGGNVQFIFKNDGKPTAIEFFDSISFFQQQQNIEKSRFSVTANLFTFRGIFNHVGRFNENLKSGGDVEWGQRVFSFGYELSYAEDTMVAHPARKSLRQLFKKMRRVAGGFYELQKQKESRIKILVHLLVNDFMPPVRRIVYASFDHRLRGSIEKIQVIFIAVICKYIVLLEKIRLILGGKPRTS